MNDRLFRQHIALLVERKRREAEAQEEAEASVPKKPPVSAKSAKKVKRTRSA